MKKLFSLRGRILVDTLGQIQGHFGCGPTEQLVKSNYVQSVKLKIPLQFA